jgi:hypothetical protein
MNDDVPSQDLLERTLAQSRRETCLRYVRKHAVDVTFRTAKIHNDR